MEFLAQSVGKKVPGDKKSTGLFNQLKQIVYAYDNNAVIILFGSRARGDWNEESDWDFLILTDIAVTETLKDIFRKKIANEIEFIFGETIFVMIKNKIDWEENYGVTNIYKSISEDGVVL